MLDSSAMCTVWEYGHFTFVSVLNYFTRIFLAGLLCIYVDVCSSGLCVKRLSSYVCCCRCVFSIGICVCAACVSWILHAFFCIICSGHFCLFLSLSECARVLDYSHSTLRMRQCRLRTKKKATNNAPKVLHWHAVFSCVDFCDAINTWNPSGTCRIATSDKAPSCLEKNQRSRWLDRLAKSF